MIVNNNHYALYKAYGFLTLSIFCMVVSSGGCDEE
jgi:hypothetical protein